MEFIKKSISAFSADSIKKYNYDEYIFYSIQYANLFGEYDEPEQFNFVATKKKINYRSVSLKQIKEIIPKYKFCCCYSKACICEFIVRYKSRDNNGIYPWIWCDLVSDHDTATPYNSKIILKILVFANFSSFNNADCYLEPTNIKCNKKIENDRMQHETNKTEDINDQSNTEVRKNTFQTSNTYEFDNLMSNSSFININYNEQIKSVSHEESSPSPLKLESETLESSTDEEIKNSGCEDLVEEIGRWSRKPDGSYKDIRVLLSSLQQVLWKDAQWEPVEFSKLMSDMELVKKVYRKAIILCHPDKHHKESKKHKSRVHLIFMAIKESHNKCNTFCVQPYKHI
ncbi:uncharacterized protein cubi_03512 [Cryptosporidium ubiquitum]|uniref:J domain-containing protein n=1 Tax=Cryptosporidium ubiquitum TaxID=857276 RepID=A0A1J4MHH3_9CRYT|nr:uncharacterized protein cubi_03512 [Cryptosporidium ubiquitum]OII73714.1 hypothetical protein cubi_03512 [Cryptosporidium ubiquitum]